MVECMTTIAEGRLILMTGGVDGILHWRAGPPTLSALLAIIEVVYTDGKNDLGFVLGVNRGKHGRFEDDVDLFQLVGQSNKI